MNAILNNNDSGVSGFFVCFATVIALCMICVLSLSAMSDDSDAWIGEEFTHGDITYQITSDSEVKVINVNDRITEFNGDIIVNYGNNDYKITSIGAKVFQNCSSLSKVVIPKYIVEIGENAFYSVPVKELIIPINVSSTPPRNYDIIFT
jgi:hypothetical protein